MKYNYILLTTRQQIIDNQYKSLRTLVNQFQLSYSTIRNIIKRYNEENRIVLKPRGDDKCSLLNKEYKYFLQQKIEETPTITIAIYINNLLFSFLLKPV